MAIGSRKVRLPELPIFRKFSLALRQEFGRAEDVLQALDESRREIRALIEGGSPGFRPNVQPAPRADRRPARRVQAPEEEDLTDDFDGEPPESFLKDSVVEPAPERQAGRPGRRVSPDATVAMRQVGDEHPADARSSSFPAPEEAEPPGQEDAASPAAEKKRPARRASKRPAGSKSSRKRAPGKASVEGGTGTSAAEDADGGPAEGQPEISGEADEAVDPGSPEQDRASAEKSPDDVEREFWGEEPSRGKGRRSKADRGRSGRVGIVRVGAEGRPVGDRESPAGETE